jgi:oxygen-dependent protoporphyrinogen oxidase
MFAGRAPAGRLMLTTFIGGGRHPSLVAADDPTLAAIVNEAHAALIGAIAPLWYEVVRWPRAIPQYRLGHLDRIAAIDAAIAAFPGLFLIGSWRGGISVGDRVNSAAAMADALQCYLAPAMRPT